MSASTLHELTAAIRSHHRALADTIDRFVAEIETSAEQGDSSINAVAEQLASFLTSDLLPHAHGEEQSLYPALDPIIREHGQPTATMRVDHEYIGAYARDISQTARALAAAAPGERTALARTLDRQAIQLQGLFRVHLDKEERVYLPLVEANLTDEQQHTLLTALHDEASHGEGPSATKAGVSSLDVREMPPVRRHPVIFDRFNSLADGDSFILINDHDPKPLFYQLKAEYVGALQWEYLEQGPDVWRVRIGK